MLESDKIVTKSSLSLLYKYMILQENLDSIASKFVFGASQILRGVGFDFNERNNPYVQEMLKRINLIGGINFKVEQYTDGSWTAESVNIDGIITGGADLRQQNDLIRDAIFTYFEIPPYLCNNALLRHNGEPVTAEQRIYASR